jgi:hypothetical protein
LKGHFRVLKRNVEPGIHGAVVGKYNAFSPVVNGGLGNEPGCICRVF